MLLDQVSKDLQLLPLTEESFFQAAALSVFPLVRANPGHAVEFWRLIKRFRVSQEYAYSLALVGDVALECDSAVNLTKWRCAFSEWEYSAVSPNLLAQAVEASPTAYDHPTIFPFTQPDDRALTLDIPSTNLLFSSSEEFLESLPGRYRYVVRKAMKQDFVVEVTDKLDDAVIRWALQNVGERFYNDHLLFIMCSILWAVARRNTWVILRDSQGTLQAMASFQPLPEVKQIRFATFVSAWNAQSQVGIRCLWEAAEWGRKEGFAHLDPTIRCTISDENDPNYQYKHRIANSTTKVHLMGSVDGPTEFQPPYFQRETQQWIR